MTGGHFKLGLFVIVSVVLLVGFLLTLGVLDRFRPVIDVETYFREPIAGLQRGADVRYRGVRIGAVRDIGFTAKTYDLALETPNELGGSIRVVTSIDAATFSMMGVQDVDSWLERCVAAGLRARLASSGLGGPTFIEFAYLDPGRFPEPALGWTPKLITVPSAPSTVGSILTAIESILRRLDQQSTFDELSRLVTRMNTLLERLDDPELLPAAEDALREFRAASAEAREVLADPRLGTLLDDASETLHAARSLLSDGRVETLVTDLTRMSATLERAAVALDGLATTVDDTDLLLRLSALVDDLGPAGRDLIDLVTRLQRLVRANEIQIGDTIRALRDAALELEALLEDAKANPSRILADPPPRRTPGDDR